jgi:RNase P/RNase MRP subunit p29
LGPGRPEGVTFFEAGRRFALVKRTVPRLDGPARAVARDELVGRAARVVQSADAGLVGLAGTVIDETLRTLTLRKADGREVRVGKRGQVFEVATPKGPVRLEGAAIEFRPEDRTKKVR